MGTPTCFDPTEAFFKRSPWFGERHKADTFTTLGIPAVGVARAPRTSLDWHFWRRFLLLLFFFTVWNCELDIRTSTIGETTLSQHSWALTEFTPLEPVADHIT